MSRFCPKRSLPLLLPFLLAMSCRAEISVPSVNRTLASVDHRTWYHLIITGQSNADGNLGIDPATRIQQHENWCVDSRHGLHPLIEPCVGFETPWKGDWRTEWTSPAWGVAEAFFEETGLPVSVSISALGGAPYSQIKKGTAPFSHALSSLQTVMNWASAQGFERTEVVAVINIHGETDLGHANLAYGENMKELQRDYDEEIRARTKQSRPLPLLLTFPGGTYPLEPSLRENLSQALVHLNQENPHIHFVSSLTFLPSTEDHHHPGVSYTRIGRLAGRKAAAVFLGQTSHFLYPLGAKVQPEKVQIEFENLGDCPIEGFELMDHQGAVSVLQAFRRQNQVELTFSRGSRPTRLFYNRLPKGQPFPGKLRTADGYYFPPFSLSL